eukprot:3181211-Ditylum_brightwellii.AAC.1
MNENEYGTEFQEDMQELLNTVDEFKCSCFKAKINVKEILMSLDDESYDPINNMLAYNVFDYVMKNYKGLIICLPDYNTESKFTKRKNMAHESISFDDIISFLNRSAHENDRFEFFQWAKQQQ